jgi:hypothetical protein
MKILFLLAVFSLHAGVYLEKPDYFHPRAAIAGLAHQNSKTV